MAQNIIFTLKADTSGIKAGMNEASEATKKAKKEVTELGRAFNNLQNMLIGMFAYTQIIEFGKQMTKVTAEVESLSVRLKDLAGSESLATTKLNELRMMADSLGIEFKGLANNYVQFVSAAKASGVSIKQAEQIFKSMSVAIAGSGASAENASRAMTALTQMLGKGKISAEELRGQLGEAMPQAFGVMAKSLGVTTQELDKMMASGQLIASEVLPKFAKEMEKAFGGNAEALSGSLQASLNRLENAWTDLYTTVGSSGIASGGVKVLSGFVKTLENSFIGLQFAWASVKTIIGDHSGIAQFMVEQQKLATQRYTAEKAIQAEKYATNLLESVQNKTADEQVKILERRAETLKANIVQGKELSEEDIKNNIYIKEQIKALLELSKSINTEKADAVPLSEAELKKFEKQRKEKEKALLLEKQRLGLEGKDIQPGAEQDPFAGAGKAFLEQFFKWRLTAEEKNAEDLAKQAVRELETDKLMRQTFFDMELQELNIQNEMKLMSEEEYLKKVLELRKKYGMDVKDVEKQLTDNDIKIKQDQKAMAVDLAGQTASGIADIVVAQKQNELNSQQALVEEQRQKGLISEEQYQSQVRAIKRKQMMMDKIAAISQIAINTAIALTNPTNIASFGAISPFIIASGAVSAGLVLAQPIPYNKGTKRVPMMRGAIRGKDSVHAILTPDERVVPADINTQPGYSALLDLAQDRKISDKEAGFIAEMAMGGRVSSAQAQIDPDVIGKAIAKYIPHTSVRINERGIAVITEQSKSEVRRLRTRIG